MMQKIGLKNMKVLHILELLAPTRTQEQIKGDYSDKIKGIADEREKVKQQIEGGEVPAIENE